MSPRMSHWSEILLSATDTSQTKDNCTSNRSILIHGRWTMDDIISPSHHKIRTMTPVIGIYRLGLLALLPFSVHSNQPCERLKATLTYTQEEAPRDLSSVLPVVVEKVNRVLDGVVDVEVGWNGADLHGRVGEHIVECTVTRLASKVVSPEEEVFIDDDGREVTSQCFHVPFTILDTNECTLSDKHPMAHKCSAPSSCVNTIGSYECLCPRSEGLVEIDSGADANFWSEIEGQARSPWEVSFSSHSRSSCPSSASTHQCCPEGAHTSEGMSCRQRFNCPTDPCGIKNDCAFNAICERHDDPSDLPNYECQCPDGLMGSGRTCRGRDPTPEPKVMFDGVTPTELTVKNNFYCGCHQPVVDVCSGFPSCKGRHEVCTVTAGKVPKCACKPGYVLHEKYGCADVNPPTLKLRNDSFGDQTLRLKQGDEYREYMVDIIDENAEDYLRSLKISYSKPLPPGCLTEVGEFHVNYTVATPWTTPSFVRVTRRVIIEDIDECTLNKAQYERTCPILVPQCDTNEGAYCVNTIGSYSCQCPVTTSGDGFKKHANFPEDFSPPVAFKGGTSCVDTKEPIITLKGPTVKTFDICGCGGLSGVMSGRSDNDEDKELQGEQRKSYTDDIKKMIQTTSGAELCATHDHKKPAPVDCVSAVDYTYKGNIDLSGRVVVGEPVQKSALHWVVPYDVSDDAGNAALTVWRDVIVQEVNLADLEVKIRQDVTREMEAEKNKAIERAVGKERVEWEKANKTPTSRNGKNCPVCAKCDDSCPNTNTGVEVDAASCQSYCKGLAATCTMSDENAMYAIIFWLEDVFPAWVVPFIIMAVLVFGFVYIVRWVVTLIFNPRGFQSYDYNPYGGAADSELFQSTAQPSTPAAPPSASLSAQNTNSFFSPGSQAAMSSPAAANTPGSASRQAQGYDNSIYQMPDIISPSKTGDGVPRRSPYR